MNNVLQAVTTQQWAIYRPALDTIRQIASRANDLERFRLTHPEALSARDAQSATGYRYTKRIGDSAVIKINGPIFPRANLLTEISGATSLELVADDFRKALKDPSCMHVVLHIDSPGGAVTGISEFAELLYRSRRKKKIVAYIQGIGASGAAWIASGCEAVVADPTALMGSVGVVFTFVDDSAKRRAEGIVDYEIVSSQSPKKRLSPAGKDGEQEYQILANDLADEFIAAVAKYRNVAPETVISDFGRGFVMVGKKAVSVGMADEIGTLEELMAEANGFVTPAAAFSIAPEKQQKMLKDIQEENSFLGRINMITVKQNKGQKVFMGSDKIGTTRPSTTTRTAQDLASNRATEYETAVRTFDTIIPFARIDNWHHLGDLLRLYRSFYMQQMADETAAIALRGIARHADPSGFSTEEEKLVNVDIGFGAIMAQPEENGGNPDNVFDEWVPGSGCIVVGDTRIVPTKGIAAADEGGGRTGFALANHGFVPGAKFIVSGTSNYNGEFKIELESTAHKIVINHAFTAETLAGEATFIQYPDFANLDELVAAASENIPEIKMRGDFSVLMARDVLSGEAQKLWAEKDASRPSEKSHVLQTLKSFGGFPGYRILGMVPGSVWLTPFKNLSVYELEGSRRKSSKQEDDKMGYTDWNYCEATNVVEDVEKMVVLNNVKFLRRHRTQIHY